MNDISANLRWLVSVGGKFWRVATMHTLAVVLFTLSSQVSLLFAFFLPLKVAILLGSNTVPSYYPDFLVALDRELLIIVLSAASLCFYLIHIASDRVVEFSIRSGVERLLARSQKLVLFANQEDIASLGYQRFSRVLAGVVFLLGSGAALFYLYAGVAYAYTAYVVVTLLSVVLLRELSVWLRAKLEKRLFTVLSVLEGTGFMFLFGFLIIDFLWFDPPGLISALIALLLVRQSLSKLSGMVGDLKGLNDSKFQLTSLFFHGQVVDSDQLASKSVWSLLRNGEAAWLPGLVAEVNEVVAGNADAFEVGSEFSWVQTGIPNILNLILCDGRHRGLLLRLFDSGASTLAQHEAALLAHDPHYLPAMKLLHVTQVQDFNCHVLEFRASAKVEPANFQGALRELRTALMGVEPPIILAQQYQRSRPMLWQKIDKVAVERMRDVTRDHGALLWIDRFEERLDLLSRTLKDLPMCVVNPEASVDILQVSDDDGDGWLLHWGRWTLEPVGAGWPANPVELALLADALSTASELRPELKAVSIAEANVAAMTYGLQVELFRQRYNAAVLMLPDLIAQLDSCESFEERVPTAAT